MFLTKFSTRISLGICTMMLMLPMYMSGQMTMTFDTGPNHPGFSFSGWSGAAGILFPTSAGVGDVAQITKNALTWDVVSFTTAPFGNGNGTWKAYSDKGDEYLFTPNVGGAQTHTLNWIGISWLRVSLINTNSGGNQSFDFDNVVYFENNSPVCNISLDGVSKLNATCCMNNGIIIVTPVTCTCTGVIEYSVNNGVSWQTSNFFGNLAPGNYTVKIRDSANQGCIDAYIGNPVVVTAVPDLINPVALCQPATIQLSVAGTATITAGQINNGSSDNCGIASMSVNPSSFTCANVGTNTVTLTVMDHCGRLGTCQATVTVQDNNVPVALCKNATVQLNSSGNGTLSAAQVNNGSTATCGIQSLSVSPSSFTCANVGTQLVTLTVTGINGLSSTCTANVSVVDTVPPVAVCQNITVQLGPNGMASITPSQVNNGSSDACGILSYALSQTNFTCANVGNNTVTLTVTDNNSNTSTCNAVVTVKALSLGNLVFNDMNRNGIFDGGDSGVNGVLVRLYLDDGDGLLDMGDGAPMVITNTAGGGVFLFDTLCPGDYIVEIAPTNFQAGGPLYDNTLMVAMVSSPVTSAPDPDNNVNHDDNGDPVIGFGVASKAITLSFAAEPTDDGDAENNTNLSLDFGFKAPTVVSINNVTMNEGTGGSTTSFNFTITRTDNSEAFSLDVNTMDGTASSPSDFTAISGGTVAFTAGGSLTATVTVLVNQDNAVEANETFNVVLSAAPPGVILADPSGLGTINNDDAAVVTLSGSAAQNEGTSFVFTVTLNNPVQGGFNLAYTTNNGTATTADNDYTDNDGSLVFAGTAGESQIITVNTTSDVKVELNETFTVALGAISGGPGGVTTSGSPQTGTITNEDAAVVEFTGNSSTIEGLTILFSVTLSNPVDVPVSVQVNTADGTAIAPGDYPAIVNQTLTFPANTTTSQNVTVTTVNDAIVESSETFTASLGTLAASGRNVSLGTASATGNIIDNDNATVTLSGGVSVSEGNAGTTLVNFTATLNNAVQGGFMANYSINDGTATTADLDYTDNDGTLFFSGTAGELQNITMFINGDLNIENNETFQASINSLSGLPAPGTVTIVGSPQTVTILNDESDWGDAPTAAQSGFVGTYPTLLANIGARHLLTPGGLHLGSLFDPEVDGQPNATSTGDGADEDGVTLPFSFITGLNSNLTVNASGAGVLNAWLDFNRDGDWSDAGEQIFSNTAVVAGNNALTVAVPVGASIGTSFARFRISTASGLGITGSATDGEVEDYQVQILNRAISINDVTSAEGNAGTTTFTFTVSLNTPAGPGGVSFDIATQDNTATTANNDYVPISLTGQVIAEGLTMYTFNVTVNGDLTVEANEAFFVNLTNVVGAGVADAQGTGTINNDDSATLTLADGVAQNEGNAGTTMYVFSATLSGSVQGGFQANYTTNNGTATTADNDYTDNDGALSYAGTNGETKFITVLANGDIKVELDETFTANLNSISGTSGVQMAAITITGSPQTGTITNDDAAMVAIAANVTQAENLTPQVFSVTLSNPVDVPVNVQFSTADGTATTGDNDYTGITNQVVTFPIGSTATQTVNVGITNDNKVENNEVYNVALNSLSSSGRNVTFGTISRTGTISNDDAAVVTLTPAGGVSIFEGNSGQTPFVFTATLNNPVQGGFTLPYTTTDGTATTANSDYVDNDGTLTFAGTMNEPQFITVNVNGDLIVENDETFTVTLGSITGAPAGVTTAGSPKTGTILNDEVDYGDTPDPTYPTLIASNGAGHKAQFGVYLGAAIDGDANGQPTGTANGDDTDAEGDDDDGVILPSVLVINNSANVTITASVSGVLNAWVDFNLNGTWESPSEQIFTNTILVAGSNMLTFAVPAGATPGMTFARFRYGNPNLTPTGIDNTGEVEDYQIQVVNTQFTIDDPMVVEGNAGTSNLVFTISRTVNANACSVDYAITGGTATTADNDYQPLAAGTINFTAGGVFTQTVTVAVNGDNKVELNETVNMTLSNPINGSILDGNGVGTITNDDNAVITISNPSLAEGCTGGNPVMVYNVSMSNPSDASVSFNHATLDGTATVANNDYLAASGMTSIAAGVQQATIQVSLVGDCFIEANETFLDRLSSLNANGRAITFSGNGATLDGTGTILNDDAVPQIGCPANITVQCASLVPAANPGAVSSTDNCGNAATITFVGDVISNQTCANRYTVTRTYLATDGCGNTATCAQTITVFDNTTPSLTCPTGITVQCAALVPAPNIALVTATDNCSGTATITHVGDVISNQTCPNRYTVTRTYRATDLCGNSATCNQIITVFDDTPPSISCPVNLTVQCANLVPVPNIALVTATDNCSGTATITHVSDVITNQTCPNRYTLTRTYRATDLCGNSATCAQIITVFDDTPPTITCPVNITVQCASLVPTPNVASVITSDNCGGTATVTFVSDAISNQTCVNRFIVTRTYRATDACGNSATCQQIITVFDNTAPIITFTDPLIQGVPNGGTVKVQCLGQDPSWEIPELGTGSISTTDNCGGSVTVAFSDLLLDQGDCATDGYINRYRLTWTATDACGNSSSAFVFLNLVDEIAPVFQGIPADTTVRCDAIPEPPLVTATDECLCACDISMVQSQPLAGCQDGQVITRTWTTTDLCGNVSTAVQHITLTDDTGPVLILTPPQLSGISESTSFDYTCNEGGIPAFYDQLNVGSVMSPPSCGNSPTITFKESTIISRNCEYSGYAEQRTYQWTGTDACGNKTVLTLKVQLIDDEEPVIIGVPDVTCIGDPALNEIEVIDNCGNGNLRYFDVEILNPCGTGKAIRRTYEGFDPCGNMVRDTAILIPDDHIPPVMTFVNPELAALQPGDVLTVACGTSEDQYTSFGVEDVSAEDNCSKGLSIKYNEKLVSTGNCATTGILASLILEWTATDICGNHSMLTAQVNIVDETAPELPGFKDEITIGCNDTIPGVIATDNCQQVIVSTRDSIVAGDCAFEYDIYRRVNAIDACGNSVTRTQLIHVGNESGPVIEGVVPELCDDLSLPEVSAYDECAGKFVPVAMVQDTLDTECRDGLVIIRTWSAKDLCGNVSEVKQTIVLNDKDAPEILIPTWSIIRKYIDQDNNTVKLSDKRIMDQLNALDESSVYVEDECDLQIDPIFSLQSILTDDCELAGYFEQRVYTWIATDVCGNATVVTFSVNVIDDLPPLISGVPADTKVTCAPLPAVPAIVAEDNAQPIAISYTESILPGTQAGTFDVTRTWVATDACGNASSASQHILWIPNTFVECAILLPPSVECSTHGVVISAMVTDGVAPYTYAWGLDGDDYLLQSGQGTSQISIYIGFSSVDVSLTVTDAYGCETVCTAVLECDDPLQGFATGNHGTVDPAADHASEVTVGSKSVIYDDSLEDVLFRPNPVNDKLQISFRSPRAQHVNMRMLNTMGQVVNTSIQNAISGWNEYTIDVSGLTEGSYLIDLQTGKEVYTQVVLVIRDK